MPRDVGRETAIGVRDGIGRAPDRAPCLDRTEDAPEEQKGGFQLGNMEIPPKLLAWLMQLDMSPENLAKLQRALDFVFDAMPQPKDE